MKDWVKPGNVVQAVWYHNFGDDTIELVEITRVSNNPENILLKFKSGKIESCKAAGVDKLRKYN